MAGSRKWFRYTTSGGDVFALNMDESNGEHVGNEDVTGLASALVSLPRNIRPRFCVYRSADGRYTRKIPVSSPAAGIDDLPTTLSVTPEGGGTAVTLNLSYFQGERITRIPTGADTGLNDGDDS